MVVNERASQIAVPADRMWRLLTSREGQRRSVAGFVDDIDFVGEGLGMTRAMRTTGHLGQTTVVERCVAFDPEEMTMSYRIIDTGGLVPFADYVGSLRVIKAGADKCVVALRSTFIPVDLDEEQALSVSQANFDLFFTNIEAAAVAE